MNNQIEYFVQELQSLLMLELTYGCEQTLYKLAYKLIKNNDEHHYKNICQAYEIVKHQLVSAS